MVTFRNFSACAVVAISHMSPGRQRLPSSSDRPQEPIESWTRIPFVLPLCLSAPHFLTRISLPVLHHHNQYNCQRLLINIITLPPFLITPSPLLVKLLPFCAHRVFGVVVTNGPLAQSIAVIMVGFRIVRHRDFRRGFSRRRFGCRYAVRLGSACIWLAGEESQAKHPCVVSCLCVVEWCRCCKFEFEEEMWKRWEV
jgi:hypothetical protein